MATVYNDTYNTFSIVHRCRAGRKSPPASSSAPIPRFSGPKNPEFSAVEHPPKFTHVTDVARAKKSPVFRRVLTAPRLTERAWRAILTSVISSTAKLLL